MVRNSEKFEELILKLTNVRGNLKVMEFDDRIKNIDFSPGNITHNDLNLDMNMPLKNQTHSLKEDLLQVSYLDEYIIDVGWYPEFDQNGCFKVQLIVKFDWSNPHLIRECRTLTQLKYTLVEFANYIKTMIG